MSSISVTPNPAVVGQSITISWTGSARNVVIGWPCGGLTLSVKGLSSITTTAKCAGDARIDLRKGGILASVVLHVTSAPVAGNYTFSDDFPGSTLDSTKWALGEWQHTELSLESDNMGDLRQVSVANSELKIRCERTVTPSGREWASGVIATKGKFSQLYGNFQARMWYAKGDGLWPAFWLLDASTEGRRPELDIMEAYPNTSNWPGESAPWPGANRYLLTNHYRDASGTMQQQVLAIDAGADLTTGWHIFEMEWRAGLLITRLDGVEKGRITANVPAVPMFIILDHVVGNWTQLSTPSTPSPADMRVDWVRVSP